MRAGAAGRRRTTNARRWYSTDSMNEVAESTPAAPTTHPADRLLNAARAKRAPVCVGLDPVWARLPSSLRATEGRAAALREFSYAVIDAVAPSVPCVKVQAACFERWRGPGVVALFDVLAYARQAKLVVILDAKRGDIGVSARHYAAMAFGDPDGDPRTSRAADWLTVNAYLGPETVAPYREAGGGVFVLVRTSNPDSDAVQSHPLADGRTVAEMMADAAAGIDEDTGTCGYAAVGAVVGATKGGDLETLRDRMPRQIFLVPGFGAQGGGVDDVLPCFDADGGGAIITASRSVIYAFDEDDDDGWRDSIGAAAADFATQLGQAVGWR